MEENSVAKKQSVIDKCEACNIGKSEMIQSGQVKSAQNETNEKRKISNRIEDMKNKHNERMDNAVKFSKEISSYLRYLAITVLGVIWLLVEKDEYKLDGLLHNFYAQVIIISSLLVLLLDLVHPIMHVIVNLLYANLKLKKPLSYVENPRKTEYVATDFPKIVVKIEWGIWFAKILNLMVALSFFIGCLLSKMFS